MDLPRSLFKSPLCGVWSFRNYGNPLRTFWTPLEHLQGSRAHKVVQGIEQKLLSPTFCLQIPEPLAGPVLGRKPGPGGGPHPRALSAGGTIQDLSTWPLFGEEASRPRDVKRVVQGHTAIPCCCFWDPQTHPAHSGNNTQPVFCSGKLRSQARQLQKAPRALFSKEK